jgi:hypothetical protein
MNTQKDASPGIEAGSSDVASDTTVTVDVSHPDLSVNDAVAVEAPQFPLPDASTPDALPDVPVSPDSNPIVDTSTDSSPADSTRDLAAETVRTLLADVAGRTFQIAADETIPDAGLYGRTCGNSNPGAVYRLGFAAEGAKVTIVRTDDTQEVILTGNLKTTSSSSLSYDLAPTFAGGTLSLRRDGDGLIGQLAILGSGVPVIWCIESPMRPV